MLLMLLACGATVEAAAAKAGISKSTAKRRLADPKFQRRLKEIKSEMVQRMADALTAAGMESVKNLVQFRQSPAPYAVRFASAKTVIELGIKVREVASFEERLAALEQQMTLNNTT
ncbi:MAG TPA: hypothetical protein VGY66_30250 [Gemmataceae bacterium]|nr:hypothetical protein [Gemmataceae bacterium]